MSLRLICFSYTSISDQTITKQKGATKKKQKMLQEIFCKPLTCFILIYFCSSKQPTQGSIKKKKKKKKKKNPKRIMLSFDISQAS